MALDHGLMLTVLDRHAVVLRLEGDIDESAERGILLAVAGALSFEPTRIDLDMSAVTFMDSCGLAVLLSVRRVAAQHKARVVLVNAPPAVRRVLDVSGMDHVLEIA